MALSVAATAIAFVSGTTNVPIGIFSWHLQEIAGLLTVVIFILALVDLVVDWRRDAWAHEDAAVRLGELKLRFRGATITEDGVDDGGAGLAAEYERTMNAITAIPERFFLRLKAKHKRKVAISQMLDTEPGTPVWLLRLRLLWRDSHSRRKPAPELPATAEAADSPPTNTGNDTQAPRD